MFPKMRSSFHGQIEEIPGIYVDNFENADKVLARAYFLSHYHSDHVQGLHSNTLLSTLEKTGAIIYTTVLTAAIINHKDGKLRKHVKSLTKGSTLITLPGSDDNVPAVTLTVTLIPAGHSAGSTMFLFTSSQQKILFTGDFRINCNDLHKYTSLHEDGAPIKLNTLYVDTTFMDSQFENFPKRSENVCALVQCIKEWLGGEPGKAVAVHTAANFGYEYVFNEIHRRLGVKVYVDDEKWRFYSKIPNLVPGVTNDEDETTIHLCKNKTEKQSHHTCIRGHKQKFLYVYLTAMKWRDLTDDTSSVVRATPSRLDVCFATHCSRGELYYFVKYLSPMKVIGFPYNFIQDEPRNKRTSCPLTFNREIKKMRVDKKVDDELLRSMFS